MNNAVSRPGTMGILSLFGLALFAYHYWGYIGHYGFDDMEYARLANDLRQGIFHPANHFTYRITVLAFTALSYHIFDVSDFASSLPALFVTIAILMLLGFHLRKYGWIVLISGLGMALFSNWFIFYSDKLMPDIYVALSILAAVLVIYQERFNSQSPSAHLRPFLLVLALFFGFLSKETVILAIPLFGILFMSDLITKKRKKFWLLTVFYMLIFGCVFLFGCYFLTGNPFVRVEALMMNSYLNACSYEQQPVGILIHRLAYGFFENMAAAGMLTGYLFVLPVLFRSGLFKILTMNTPFHFFSFCAILLLLSANFMTVSPTGYSPMCMDPRHFLFLIPIVAIPAAMSIGDLVKNKIGWPGISFTLGFLCILAYYFFRTTLVQLYLPLFVLVFVYGFLRIKSIWKVIFISLLLGILMRIPAEMILYAPDMGYKNARAFFIREVVEKNPSWYIISDPISTQVGAYYSGFNENRNYKLLEFGRFDPDTLDERKKVVYYNKYYLTLSGITGSRLPRYVQSNFLRFSETFADENNGINGVKLIFLSDSLNLSGKGENLITDILNFEIPKTSRWNYAPEMRTDSVAFGGTHAAKVHEFSATFQCDLDSLSFSEKDLLRIETTLQVNATTDTDAYLVVEVRSGEKMVYYDALSVDLLRRAFGHWWEVPLSAEINVNEIPARSSLKVYVWNKNMRNMVIDDFAVHIEALNFFKGKSSGKFEENLGSKPRIENILYSD